MLQMVMTFQDHHVDRCRTRTLVPLRTPTPRPGTLKSGTPPTGKIRLRQGREGLLRRRCWILSGATETRRLERLAVDEVGRRWPREVVSSVRRRFQVLGL